MSDSTSTNNMTKHTTHRKHHAVCGLAHLALAGIVLFGHSWVVAVASAEVAVAIVYFDLAWRERS
jgi:hypothetical protein